MVNRVYLSGDRVADETNVTIPTKCCSAITISMNE